MAILGRKILWLISDLLEFFDSAAAGAELEIAGPGEAEPEEERIRHGGAPDADF